MNKDVDVNINVSISIPDDELEEFLRFEFGDNGSMSGDNPFRGQNVDPIFGTFMWNYE